MLVSILWQSTLLLALGLTAAHLLSHRPARAHAALVSCTLAALLAPGLTGLFDVLGLGLLGAPVVRPTGGALPPDTGLASVGSVSTMEILTRLGLVFWAGATILLALRLLFHLAGSRRMAARAGYPADAETVRLARVASKRCGLTRMPRVLAAVPSLAPAVWAWSRPARLFLPTNLEEDELRAALFHELGHLRRRDHLSFLLTHLTVCVLPWNPLAWQARRRAAALAEEACDTWALASGVPPAVMARTLVAAIPSHAALGLSLKRDRRQLETRISHLFESGSALPQVGSGWARTAGIGLALMLTGLALAQRGSSPGLQAASPAAAVHDEWDRRIEVLRAAGRSAIVVQPGELDLGVVEPGSTAHGSLWLLNPGDEPRTVLGTAASCGCTRVILPSPAIVPAAGVLELAVEMDAPTELGSHKTKTVTLRLEGQSPVQLPVTTHTWHARPVELNR